MLPNSTRGGHFFKITIDNGGSHTLADKDTALSVHGSDETIALENIQAGDQMIAWYEGYAAAYPAHPHGELVQMIYAQAGKPVVNFAMDYADVIPDVAYADSIRWSSSENPVSGYENGMFGIQDTVTREQLVAILWRYAGTSILADYPDLS